MTTTAPTVEASRQAEFQGFADAVIRPHADRWDREEQLPPEIIRALAGKGYLGAVVSPKWGGSGMGMMEFGWLNAEVGRACSSVRSLLTVHSMVCGALDRWGTDTQKALWLRKLTTGEMIGAFAISEPNVGSDAAAVQTTAIAQGEGYRLDGTKKWISFGQIADLILVLAKTAPRVSAFLVERSAPGLSRKPIAGMLGLRASMLAELKFDGCLVPATSLLGESGFGLWGVAATALDLGRFSVAWGCVGIAQACLDASVRHCARRQQFGKCLKDHQLVQRILTDMVTNLEAARLLCIRAGQSREAGSPDTLMQTCMAKYFASVTCTRIASDALQIHGALGCSPEASVSRYFRDAQIMEIIEGSTQIQQSLIAGLYCSNPDSLGPNDEHP